MSISGNNILAGASGSQQYKIDRSLRFNDDDSAYLSRTPSSAGNRKTWTWSSWLKRSTLSGTQVIWEATDSGGTSNRATNRFNSSTFIGSDSSTGLSYTTTQVFRDVSAWYHIVISMDTTQATNTNRFKLYVNGSQVTSFSSITYPTQNADTLFCSSSYFNYIGATQPAFTQYFDGYMAEVNFVDGTALGPSDFGETDAVTGAWIPKQYSGSYGTNGFYLNFSDNSGVTATTLGKDSSGNGNNFTPNNFSVSAGAGNDSLEDTPTNNWCTANPLDAGSSSLVFSNGNLDIGSASGNWTDCRSTFAVSSGKWYWETKINTGASFRPFVGILSSSVRPASNSGSATEQLGETTNSYAYWTLNGILRHNAGNITVTTASAGDTVQIALDMDNGKIYFGLNNTYFDSSGGSTGAPSTGSNPSYSGITLDTVSPAFELYNGTSSVSVNFGQRAFDYTPPTGFKALNTANLPVPTIKDGTEYFNTVLYTGVGGTQSVTGVGFQPDFAWFKRRDGSAENALHDAVRGVRFSLASDGTGAELDRPTYVTSFDTDGFTFGDNVSNYNSSSSTYVAWNWKAGGSGSANTDGTTSSTVSVNADAGFSIVSYTGTGANATVGHGLNDAPKFIITKSRDTADNWFCFHESIGNTKYIRLDSSSTPVTSSTLWNNTSPTSTTFSLGTSGGANRNNDDHIAYCFAEVEGYSKFGSYTGNGSTDGPFVACGFSVQFVLVKRTDSTDSWQIHDISRAPFNPSDKYLLPDSSGAEGTSTTVDFLSNGFKLRNSSNLNNSGGSFLFMAFAETPFKYANAA